MKSDLKQPETLAEAIKYFADPDRALQFVVSLRWRDGVACPLCKSKEVGFLKTRRIWKCRSCRKQFSVKVGTIFEDSPLGLDKWLPAMWMVANCRNGVSSYEIHRELGVTQKTGWFMLHRIRLAMQTKSFNKVGGAIEVDETFIGGLAKNMHFQRRMRISAGPMGKTVVLGFLKRGKKGKSRIDATVIPTTSSIVLGGEVRKRVNPGATIYSDEYRAYRNLRADYVHRVINHTKAYAEGVIHTNGIENFWSLLKRALKGTYISVDPAHLFRYVDEQSHRFNNRNESGLRRFSSVLSRVTGKRLTYKGLINTPAEQTC